MERDRGSYPQLGAGKMPALKAYWERCAGSHPGEPKELEFHRRKTILRKAAARPDSRVSVSAGKERANTVVGFDIDSVDKNQVSAHNLHRNENETVKLKQSVANTLRGRRNCVSALDERSYLRRLEDLKPARTGDSHEWEKSSGLDFTDKIKAFRALIRTTPSPFGNRHKDIPLEDVQDLGSHMRFLAKSRAYQTKSERETEFIQNQDNRLTDSYVHVEPSSNPAHRKDVSGAHSYLNSFDIVGHENDPDFDHVTYLADVRALNFSLHETEHSQHVSEQAPLQVPLQNVDQIRPSLIIDYDKVCSTPADDCRHVNGRPSPEDCQTCNDVNKYWNQHLKPGKVHTGHTRVIRRDNLSNSKHVIKQVRNGLSDNSEKLCAKCSSPYKEGILLEENRTLNTESLLEKKHVFEPVEITPKSRSAASLTADIPLRSLGIPERSKSATPLSMKVTDDPIQGVNSQTDTPFLSQLKSHISVLSASLECLSNIVSNGPDTESNSARTESSIPVSLGTLEQNHAGKVSRFVLQDIRNAAYRRKPRKHGVEDNDTEFHSFSGLDTQLRHRGCSSQKQTNLQGFEHLGCVVANDSLREGGDVESVNTAREEDPSKPTRSQYVSDDLRKKELRKMIKFIYKRSSSLRDKSPNKLHKDEDCEVTEEGKAFTEISGEHYNNNLRKSDNLKTNSSTVVKNREQIKIIPRNAPSQIESHHSKYTYVSKQHNVPQEGTLNNDKEDVELYNRTQGTHGTQGIFKDVKSKEKKTEPKIIKRNNMPSKYGQPLRSQSEVFFRNTLKESCRQSPLPSKSTIGSIPTKTRPRSALDGFKKSPKKITMLRNIPSERIDQPATPFALSDVSSSLKSKLVKLRTEIDQRLSSKENLSHFVWSVELKGLDADVHSFGDVNSPDSSTEEANNSAGSSGDFSDASTISHCTSLENYSEELKMLKLSSMKTSREFITSTPVKTTASIDETGRLDKRESKSTAYGHSYPSLQKSLNIIRRDANKEKQLIRNGRESEFSDDDAQPVRKSIDKNRVSRDDINVLESTKTKVTNIDAETYEQDRMLLNKPCSAGTREKSSDAKKEIVSRILNKMSTRNESPATIYSLKKSSETRILRGPPVFSSGRESPAERLLCHLDNPRLVKLLQMLYKADPLDRQIIMIKVEYFTAWHEFTVVSREHRRKKTTLMKESLKYNVVRLLSSHFIYWKQRAMFCIKTRKADAIFRRHMLAKGFKALQWSVSQSMHLLQKLQTKYHNGLVKGTFLKWKLKSEMQRRERIEHSFGKWKQFVQETLKVRYMQGVSQKNKLIEVIRCWKKIFIKHQKENKACRYFRLTLLRHALTLWKDFVLNHKVKKEKVKLAVLQYESSLQRQMFHVMVSTYKTSQMTKAHFRYHLMKNIFHLWKGVSEIFKAERNADIVTSVEHWKAKRIQFAFSHWHEQLKIRRAEKMFHFSISKKYFMFWLKTWKDNMSYRSHIEQMMLHRKLHTALLRWRQNVVLLKRRQKLAVALIENCYTRQTFNSWMALTRAKRLLRKKVSVHKKFYEEKSLQSCFIKWRQTYLCRKKAETAKRIFSEVCARKMAAHWKVLCHRRSLSRLMDCTQPHRDQRLLRSYFSTWLSSLEKLCKINVKAEEHMQALQCKRSKNIFMFWLQETKKLMKIKPLVQQRRQRLLIEVFTSWRSIVEHKSECKKNIIVFQQRILLYYFQSWKRQYKICQIAKEVDHRLSQGLLLVVLDSWRSVIVRKKKGEIMREKFIMKHIFYTWKNKATSLYNHRTRLQEELESNMDLKRWSFRVWRKNVVQHKSWVHQTLLSFVEKTSSSHVFQCFLLWRRHLHSTLISKAYNRAYNVRLLGTYFSAWQQLSGNVMEDAVYTFSERIGLVDAREKRKDMLSFQDSDFDESEDGNKLLSLESSSPLDVSEESFNESLISDSTAEIDRRKLLNDAIEAARDNRLAKCSKLKETVTKAITRLMHWPLCVAFEQWKEYYIRKSQLKAASTLLKSTHDRTITVMAFHDWKKSYLQSINAKQFRNVCTLRRYFDEVRVFKDYRKYIKHLLSTAHRHRMLKSFQKYFPIWLHKAEEKHQKNYVLHLWNSETPREMELYHLEKLLTKSIHHRTLMLCFSHWLIKYKAISKIRNVYHNNLLQWVFITWKDWALGRHLLSVKSHIFLQQRQTKMTFKKWCQRLEQNRHMEQMYKQAWHNYLLLILLEWRQWAKNNHKLQLLRIGFEKGQSRKKLSSYFLVWRCVTIKVNSFRCNSRQKLLYRMFSAWRHVVKHIQSEQSVILKFQVHSYTILVKRLFYKWLESFKHQKQCSEERKLVTERRALNFASTWRKKAQKTRGLKLKTLFERRRILQCFQHWKTSLARIQVLYTHLDGWLSHKHTQLSQACLRTWMVQMLSQRACKVHTSRTMLAMLSEWKSWTKISKERRIRGLALKKALQERNLHVYFQYWVAMTRVKQSVQQNVEMKLQIRVFRAWRNYSRRTCRLRELQEQMNQKVNTRILHGAFMNMRWRAEYCSSLSDMAEKMVHDREVATMRAALVLWKDRINSIEAQRCYQIILSVRVVKRWHKFVTRRRLENQQEEDNWTKAIQFYNQSLCKTVMKALKQEVAVQKLVEKRRQRKCELCAKMWKSRVDLTVTAVEMERDFKLRRFWAVWRNEYIQSSCAVNLCNQYDKHTLSQIFKAWQKLCRKPQPNLWAAATSVSNVNHAEQRSSLLPVPVSQAKSALGQKTFFQKS